MAAWDDVQLLDMAFDEGVDSYTYPCPCGDLFTITVEDLLCAEDLAPCPSCSLLLRVVYDPEEFLASLDEEIVEEEIVEVLNTDTMAQSVAEGDDGAPQAKSIDQVGSENKVNKGQSSTEGGLAFSSSPSQTVGLRPSAGLLQAQRSGEAVGEHASLATAALRQLEVIAADGRPHQLRPAVGLEREDREREEQEQEVEVVVGNGAGEEESHPSEGGPAES